MGLGRSESQYRVKWDGVKLSQTMHLTYLEPERPAIAIEDCRLACKRLPAQDRDIHVSRVDLDSEARAADHFGSDDGRPRAAERFVDRLPGR